MALPNFASPAPAAPHGYQGLDAIFQLLTSPNGLNSAQVGNLGKGYTGGNGYAVGGLQGQFAGLSPYAANWLATSGILQQDATPSVDTTGLSGTDLIKANIQNALSAMQPTKYHLASGISENDLQNYLGQIPQGAYAKGFDASGSTAPAVAQPGGGNLPDRTHVDGKGASQMYLHPLNWQAMTPQEKIAALRYRIAHGFAGRDGMKHEKNQLQNLLTKTRLPGRLGGTPINQQPH